MEINLKNIVLIISFIIWLVYIFLIICKEINTKNNLKIPYSKYLKENIYQILRVDKLLLIIVFFLYSRFNKTTVDIYLFCIIMLYLLVNLLYEEIKVKKVKFKKEWPYFLILLGLAIAFISIYFLTKKLVLSCMLLFSYLYFFPFIFAFINYFLQKKSKK